MNYELIHNETRRAPKVTVPDLPKAYSKPPKEDKRVSKKTATEGLKPCPWCGAKAEVLQDNVRTWGLIEHEPDCWLAYDEPRHKQEIPRAEFDAWNRRADV